MLTGFGSADGLGFDVGETIQEGLQYAGGKVAEAQQSVQQAQQKVTQAGQVYQQGKELLTEGVNIKYPITAKFSRVQGPREATKLAFDRSVAASAAQAELARRAAEQAGAGDQKVATADVTGKAGVSPLVYAGIAAGVLVLGGIAYYMLKKD